MKIFWTYKRFPKPWGYVFLISGFILPILTAYLKSKNQTTNQEEFFVMWYFLGIALYFVIARFIVWLISLSKAKKSQK